MPVKVFSFFPVESTNASGKEINENVTFESEKNRIKRDNKRVRKKLRKNIRKKEREIYLQTNSDQVPIPPYHPSTVAPSRALSLPRPHA
jgi:hypothetical protein